jgi:hypothetical protein
MGMRVERIEFYREQRCKKEVVLNSKGNIQGLKASFTYKCHPSNCI